MQVEPTIEPPEVDDLGTPRLLRVFAVMAVALLIALAAAPLRARYTEWRAAQTRYNDAAVQVGAPTVAISIKQIWKPELDRVDRCVSCHLGMGEATPDPHVRVFAAHPTMAHEPHELGCTLCHGGQGRATRERDAHGNVAFWDEPLLPRPYLEASCGTCHTGVRVAGAAERARGQSVFEASACFDCHRIAGKGRGNGPDLSRVGLAGFARDWHERHVEHAGRPEPLPASASAPAAGAARWATSFAALTPADRVAVEAYLTTLVGAPRWYAGKALSFELGCRGYHLVDGVGGEEGPDLSNEGGKIARELDYAGVRGAHTLPEWLRQHFLDPARVVPSSLMPDLDLSDDQAVLLTGYMLSLRGARKLPDVWTPRDRLRVSRLGERDFAGDGTTVYAAFCSGCHGAGGAGRRFGVGDTTFPAIGVAAFLAVVPDELLRTTIANGRPGRKMPAWGSKAGGLTSAEIDAVVGYLRSLEPPPVARELVIAGAMPTTIELPLGSVTLGAPVERELGRRLYGRDCAACHGPEGMGTAIGPPLAAGVDEVRTLDALAAHLPGMGAFRTYRANELAAVLAQVRALPPGDGSRATWRPVRGDADRGAAAFADVCAGCHGPKGEGRSGPALANPAFLAAADDGYLRAMIVRGRGDTAMPSFGAASTTHRALAADEVADIVAFVRSFAKTPPPPRRTP